MRNAAALAVSGIFSQLIITVTNFLIIRYLGLTLYSEYATAMLFVIMFSVLGRIGFSQVFLREGSRDISKAGYYYFAALLLNGMLVITALLAALIISYYRFDSKVFILTVVLGTSMTLMSLRLIPMTVFQINQKLHYAAFIVMLGAVGYATSVFTAMYFKASVLTLAILHLSMDLFVFVLCFIVSLRFIVPKFDYSILKNALSQGKRFCAIDMLLAAYSNSSGFILSILNLGVQVGIYNAAYRLFALTDLINVVIVQALSPAVYESSYNKDRIIRGARLALRYFIVTAILLGAIFIGRSKWLMVTAFRAEFIQSATVLKIISISLIFRFFLTFFSHVVYSGNKEAYMIKVVTFVLALSIILGLIVIPMYGSVGAAVTFLVCEITLGLLCLLKGEAILDNPGFWKLLFRPVFSGLVTFIFLFCTQSYPITGLLIAPLVFYGILLVTGYYRTDELVQLVRLFFNITEKTKILDNGQ